MRRRAVLAVPVGLAVLSVLCLGCGGPAVDKQGARRSAVVKLRLGAADPGEPSLAHFVEVLDRTSAGRLAVDVDRRTYYSETPGGPAKLAPDLRSGAVDLALIPSRDWAATGDSGFAALQAPFVIASTLATTSLAHSDVARNLLQHMANYGAVGLGLIPGEPRRLLTREPLVDNADLSGARIRVSDSGQTMSLLSALGADPVQGMSANDVRKALAAGTLDGVEMAPQYLGQNGYHLTAPYLTSFALIPKFEVLAASPHAWGGLSARDRQALSAAAADTVNWEAHKLAGDETAELSLECANGLVVVAPSASALATWRAEAPTPDGPDAAAVGREIRASVRDFGHVDLASDLPRNCPLAVSAGEAHALHGSSGSPAGSPAAPAAGPTIPPGTYRETVTAKQFAAAGLSGSDFAKDITYTWVIRPDGTFEETQDPDYPDQGPQSGRYVVDGDQWMATYDPGADGTRLPAEQARWSFYDGILTFSQIRAEDAGSKPLYEQPWHKIG